MKEITKKMNSSELRDLRERLRVVQRVVGDIDTAVEALGIVEDLRRQEAELRGTVHDLEASITAAREAHQRDLDAMAAERAAFAAPRQSPRRPAR